ncbi:hypothetical protein [Sorangium atrum]|uniref:Secreted protein n=1 Tax=Sorangium atrum TaxID=2995308 RepID=A0ABT5C1V9_9BACT|nr:hypothetical protein [Sorangium aterium]MDC0679673.1 hypothetical protein [Sorangium aterium]
MPYSRFTALTLAVMGGLGALGISRPSSACTPAPDGPYASAVPRAVPLDGIIVARVSCYSHCPESAPELVVKDKDTGEAISGAQEEVADVLIGQGERLLGFRPAAPLVDGHTYQVEVEGQNRSVIVWETQASAAVDMDVGAVPVQANITLGERWHGETSCCTADLGPGSCGPQESCVAEEMERYVTVSLDVSGGADHGVGQYVQIFTFSSPDGKELAKKTVWEGHLSQTYDVAATEYCYQLTYKSLVDGATVETERTCVPHGDAGATGVFPADATRIGAAVAACASPPEGFEEAWCDARAAYCDGRGSLCAEDDVSSCEDPGTGAGGSGGSGAGGGGSGGSGVGGGGSGGSGAGGGGDSPEDPDGGDDSGGCSVSAGSAGRSASPGWALPAIGLALSLASRARRRRDRR